MNYVAAMGSAIANFANPVAVAMVLLGTLIGVFVGAVPGLAGLAVLAVLLPFLYNINPVVALSLLIATSASSYYAASTTAILINTPGHPEAAATCIDGYAMTRRGMVGRALGASAAATTYGGWVGAVGILAFVPLMTQAINLFHPPDYFFLTILAVVLIGQLQSGSATKGILSGLLGFLISFVGAAASTGSLRYTGGILDLYDGVNIAAVAIGLFAIGQMCIVFAANRPGATGTRLALSRQVRRDVRDGVLDVVRRLWLATRCSCVGLLCGIIPGIGSTAANFISYGYAMNSSPNKAEFGTGAVEGVIAPEASSISKEAGALIPTMALGIPNGPAMAIVLAAFSIVGLSPGPTMLTRHLSIVFWMVLVLAVTALLASALGLALSSLLAMITAVPGAVLFPFVIVIAAIGVFAATSSLVQVAVMMFMGAIGVVMRRYNYSLPAVIVGVVLGVTAEDNLILTNRLYGWRFIERPFTDVLILAIAAVIYLGMRRRRRTAGQEEGASKAGSGAAPADRSSSRTLAPVPVFSWWEAAFDALWVVGSAVYVLIGLRYPPPADIGPAVLGSATFVVAAFQLAGMFVPSLRRVTHGTRPGAAAGARAPRRERASVAARNWRRQREVPVPAAVAFGDGATPDAFPLPAAVALAPPVGREPAALADRPAASQVVSPAAMAPAEPSAEHAAEAAATALINEAATTDPRRQVAGVAMALALLPALYVLGFLVATPVFTLAYFLGVRRWNLVGALAAAAGVTALFFLFSQVLTSVIFPTGIL